MFDVLQNYWCCRFNKCTSSRIIDMKVRDPWHDFSQGSIFCRYSGVWSVQQGLCYISDDNSFHQLYLGVAFYDVKNICECYINAVYIYCFRCCAFGLCSRQSISHTDTSGAICTGEGELHTVWCNQLTKVSSNHFRGKQQWSANVISRISSCWSQKGFEWGMMAQWQTHFSVFKFHIRLLYCSM